MCLISFADINRIVYVSGYGIATTWSEEPRNTSVDAHCITSPLGSIMLVQDVARDSRFTHLHHRRIHDQPIQFYASVAIELKNVAIGMN